MASSIWRRIPHIITVNKTVAANATDSISVAIGGDPVEIYGIAGTATSASYRINLAPSDTGKNLITEAIASACVVGTAMEPARIDGGGAGYGQPLVVLGGSQITFNFVNLTGADNTIQLALYGFRLLRA